MGMAKKPVFQLHIVTGFGIRIAAAREDCNKKIRLGDIPGNRVIDIQRVAGPVHLHGISGLVLDPHGGFRDPGPLPVFFAELRVHVRRGALVFAAPAIFRPQQCQIYAWSC